MKKAIYILAALLTFTAAEGKGVAEMARAVGVSRQTVYSWLKNQQRAELAA